MKCLNCNQELDEGASFCGNCGQPVAVSTQITQPIQGQNTQASFATPPMGQASFQPQGGMTVAANFPQPSITADKPEGGGKAIAGLVLGILGLAGWLIPIIGLIMGVLALVFGSISLKTTRRGFGIAGVVLGSIVVLISLAAWAFSAYYYLQESGEIAFVTESLTALILLR